ncbi:hypothetical protein ACSSS7_006089 [Eimeria intestinalis]
MGAVRWKRFVSLRGNQHKTRVLCFLSLLLCCLQPPSKAEGHQTSSGVASYAFTVFTLRLAGALLPGGDGASPATPKEAICAQQLQPHKSLSTVPNKTDSGAAAAAVPADAAVPLRDTCEGEQPLAAAVKSPRAAVKPETNAVEASVAAASTAAAGDKEKQAAPPAVPEKEAPRASSCLTAEVQEGKVLPVQQQQQEAQQEEQQQQQQQQVGVVGGGLSVAETAKAPALQQPGGPPGPTSSFPPRRGSDRSGEWHPLDAVVERIESHVRPGAGGCQRLQWSKGFRMPLGAEGRQILLRRLRKAYHANPMRWDEELARHRIVFSRMPYATVIELFHLAHLLGVFDFAVRCSEEYGTDAAGGATHRKRRPARSGAGATAAAAAAAAAAAGSGGQHMQQGGNAGEGGCGVGFEGADGEQGGSSQAAGGSAAERPLQGRRKRRSASSLEGVDASQLQSARPKRSRRFSPAYLKDYEMMAETCRLPPPPVRKAASAAPASFAGGAAASQDSLLNWDCVNDAELMQQLRSQDQLFAAALGGRECASATMTALEGRAAATGAASACGHSSASSGALQQSESLEFRGKPWAWGPGQQRDASDLGALSQALPEAAFANSFLGTSSAESELGAVNALLQREEEMTNKQQQLVRDVDLTTGSKGRIFFSTELSGDAYGTTFVGSSEGRKQQKLRCSGSSRNANNGAFVHPRRNRKSKLSGPARDLLSLPVAASPAATQPSLAELLVDAGVKTEGNAASAPAAVAAPAGSAGEGSAGESSRAQLNLHLLTTNYTIAAQYLQVLELLAVQRQIMELTQSLNSKKAGAASALGVEAAGIAGVSGPLSAALGLKSPKLDAQSLLSQQLLLQLGAEAGLTTAFAQQAQGEQQQAAASALGATATNHQLSLLNDLEKKVSALESLAAEGTAAASVGSPEAQPQLASGKQASAGLQQLKCKRDLSRQSASALSCSTPDSPVDGYESASASPCCSGNSSSACNTPDSLGSDRLLLFSSLWHPLPPAEGLAGANL